MYDTFYTHIPAIRFGLFCLWFLWVVSYVMEVTDLSKHCSDWNIEAVRAEMEKKNCTEKSLSHLGYVFPKETCSL